VGEAGLGDLGTVSLLAEPVRRRLYERVAGCARPTGRDELAAAVGIGRSLAAYHLDKLAAHGLLEVEYGRPSGRGGPGAGRPAKLYRRAEREFGVRVPARDYRLLADLLAEVVAAGGTESRVRGEHAARERGRSWGRSAGPAGDAPRAVLERLLRERGYEPVGSETGELRLRNCPFDAVAARRRELVCGLNLALLEGMLEGLAAGGFRAELAPAPGACCVVIAG